MDEHWRNFPLKVTREVAIGYALYWGLFGPHMGGSSASWWLVIGGGAVLLCIVAAIEVQIVRRRQRNRDDQPLVPDSDATP